MAQTKCPTFQLSSKKPIGRCYVVNTQLDPSCSRLAVNLSSDDVSLDQVQVLDVNTLTRTSTVMTHSANPTLKFVNKNQLLVSTNKCVQLFDVRQPKAKSATSYFINTDIEVQRQEDLHHLTCFDVNADGSLLAAGTDECSDQNVYVHLWDWRKPNQVWRWFRESHFNDISEVAFHPTETYTLATAGGDELVNIFDVNEQDEDEALTTTLNCGNAVAGVRWCQAKNKSSSSNNLVCLTRDETVQFWDIDEAKPCKELQPKSGQFDYAIDYLAASGLLAVGLKNGTVLFLDSENDNVKTTLNEGHDDIVRSICSSSDFQLICTGGEDGAVCLWRRDESEDSERISNKEKLVMKMTKVKSRPKPY